MDAAFSLAIQGFVDKTIKQQHKITNDIVGGVIDAVVMESPVDTGKFVGDWLLGVDSVPSGTTDIFDTMKYGTVVHLQEQVPYEAAGHTYNIVNNSEYGWPLENGHSMQAPNGMVEKAVVKFEKIVDIAVGNNK